jgi:hypothetical protein
MAIVPNVVGMLKGDAISALKIAGFTSISVNSVRYAAKVANHGTIQGQNIVGFTPNLSDEIIITAYEVLSRQVIKKVEIPLEDQPYMTDDGKYYLRYRVVSESGISTSEWSPVAVLVGRPILDIIGTEVSITISSDDFSMNVNWDIPDTLKNTTFDGYARWDGKIVSVVDSLVNSQAAKTIEVEYDHNLVPGDTTTLGHDGVYAEIPVIGLVEISPGVYHTKKFLVADFSGFPYVPGDRVRTAWEFVATTTANNLLVKIKDGHRTTNVLQPNYAQIWIQIPTRQKIVSEFAKIGESVFVSTRPTVTDGILRTQ